MKKIFPEAPDVTQHIANRAAKIVERHFKAQHAKRASELSEEAKVRLFRDLQFFFESGGRYPSSGNKGGLSLRRWLDGIWERFENFMGCFVAADGTSIPNGVLINAAQAGKIR